MSDKSGPGREITNHGARSGQFTWGDHGRFGRKYTAMIYAIWHTVGEEQVLKQIARDTIREMSVLIGQHGVAEQVKLELLLKDVTVGSLQLTVVPGDKNGVEGMASIA